jgi:hypothetical protein
MSTDTLAYSPVPGASDALTTGSAARVAAVRLPRVYDRGAWIAPAVGYWDKLGYTRCLDCPPPEDRSDVLVYADNSAAQGQACDFCHAPLPADPDPEG